MTWAAQSMRRCRNLPSGGFPPLPATSGGRATDALRSLVQTVNCRSMTQESARDSRADGYIMLSIGLLYAAQAVDRICFHKTIGLRWLTATLALVGLAQGTWMIVGRRPPLSAIDDWAKERWGLRGVWLINAVFAAVGIGSIWLLGRLG